jgi:alkylation response protein AidB-like acyl-CoA dehydrogenase
MNTVTGQSDQTRMLRESGADFVKRYSDLKRVRAARRKLPGYDPELREKMTASGWFGLLVPEDLGGYGGSFADMAALVGELGKGLIAEPLVAPAVLAARTLVHCGGSETARGALARLMSGETTYALAWQGRDGGWPADGGVVAKTQGSAMVLSGAHHFVAGAGAADAYIIAARGESGLGLYLVDQDKTGLQATHEWRVDGTPITTLNIEDVKLTTADCLAKGEAAASALARAIDEAAVMVAAELLGVMSAVFDLTLQYLRTRVQFGKAIGSFQALQHRMVDQYVQLRLASASVESAVRSLDEQGTAGDEYRRSLNASRAKARCSDAALRIAREAIQLHGAIGFTDEYDAGLYLKRALVLSAWLGNGAQHRQRYGGLVYDRH